MTKRATQSWLRRVGIGAVMAGVSLGVAGVSVNGASANHTQTRFTICHATASNANPYTTMTLDEASVDGLVPPQGDHFHGHTGPVWNPTLKALNITWGDIIPPVPGHHAGLNWDAAGQAIWNNGCAIPGAANTYVCSAAAAVTHDSATLNAATSDATVTEAVFTLQPGNIQLTDNTGGSPFSVPATGLTPSTAYTYSVEFNPGAIPQSNADCGFTTSAAPFVPTYACSAATLVTHNSATLNGSTTDPAATSAVFTLQPGGVVLNDNNGAPFTVDATGLTPSTAYTYTVVFNPGANPQTVAAPCGFTTAAAPVIPGPVVVVPPPAPPAPPAPPVEPPAEDQCPDQDGFQDNIDQCVEVLPDVVVPQAPVVPEAPDEVPAEVAGVAVPRELPRTGSTTLPLLQVGLGLILLGAGAVLFGRERTALI